MLHQYMNFFYLLIKHSLKFWAYRRTEKQRNKQKIMLQCTPVHYSLVQYCHNCMCTLLISLDTAAVVVQPTVQSNVNTVWLTLFVIHVLSQDVTTLHLVSHEYQKKCMGNSFQQKNIKALRDRKTLRVHLIGCRGVKLFLLKVFELFHNLSF